MPADFKLDVDEMRAKAKAAALKSNFQPASMLTVVWSAFWELRRTKDAQFPIMHRDILDYQEAVRIELDIWEIKAILSFDQAYYAAKSKYKE